MDRFLLSIKAHGGNPKINTCFFHESRGPRFFSLLSWLASFWFITNQGEKTSRGLLNHLVVHLSALKVFTTISKLMFFSSVKTPKED